MENKIKTVFEILVAGYFKPCLEKSGTQYEKIPILVHQQDIRKLPVVTLFFNSAETKGQPQSSKLEQTSRQTYEIDARAQVYAKENSMLPYEICMIFSGNLGNPILQFETHTAVGGRSVSSPGIQGFDQIVNADQRLADNTFLYSAFTEFRFLASFDRSLGDTGGVCYGTTPEEHAAAIARLPQIKTDFKG